MASFLLCTTVVPSFSSRPSHRYPLFSYIPLNVFTNRRRSTGFDIVVLFPPGRFQEVGWRRLAGASVGEAEEEGSSSLVGYVGEDSAAFELSQQKFSSWVSFTLILSAVLVALNVLWIDGSSGFGKEFVDSVSGLSESHEVVMLLLVFIFATVHSGMASLIGECSYLVLFAGISLPLAVTTIVYFINHRYDGSQLWNLQSVPGVHQLMVGQVVWCLAHTLWVGNSVVLAASVGLIAHNLFGVWNGDRRLAARHGEAFEDIKSHTSIIPFAAILGGRQMLPSDYYKEFLRLPYLTITIFTLGAYFAHLLMQAASFQLHW